MKAKPNKWGVKLFVLADSSNGYTCDFSIYAGKSRFVSGQGLLYDVVNSLMDSSFLGRGYHLYVDNFYTSPKLLVTCMPMVLLHVVHSVIHAGMYLTPRTMH